MRLWNIYSLKLNIFSVKFVRIVLLIIFGIGLWLCYRVWGEIMGYFRLVLGGGEMSMGMSMGMCMQITVFPM